MPHLILLDVGSTTTKARLVTTGADPRMLDSANVATTVEPPLEDVMLGAERAIAAVAARHPAAASAPVVATSSAAGGLRVLVIGTFLRSSAGVLARAAQAGGGIVAWTLAYDDGRTWLARRRLLLEARPDAILLGGGYDGTAFSPQLAIWARALAEARPPSRFRPDRLVPVVYAGCPAMAGTIRRVLADFPLVVAANVTPAPNREDGAGNRRAVEQVYLEHVVRFAPGYERLLERAGGAVLPTPVAFGFLVEAWASQVAGDVVAFDLGGATTDVYSVSRGRFHRSVSPNLGLSYSIKNAVEAAGAERLAAAAAVRLGRPVSPDAVRDYANRKMLYPTALPDGPEALELEAVIAEDVLARALRQHLLDLRHRLRPAHVLGSGSFFAHGDPERVAVALARAVATVFPRGAGRVRLYRDRHFIAPHLGAYLQRDPEQALALFHRLALEPLTAPRSARVPLAACPGATAPGTAAAEPAPAFGLAQTQEAGSPIAAGAFRVAVRTVDPERLTVPPGSRVRAGDVVGTLRETLRLPWVVRAAERLECPPAEVHRHLDVAPGGAVTRHQVVGRAIHAAYCRILRAPADTVLEAVDPTGVAWFVEVPRGEPVEVDVAAALGIEPAKVPEVLLVREGDEVLKGSYLAAAALYQRIRQALARQPAAAVPAPVSGRVTRITPDGRVRVDPMGHEEPVPAPAHGTLCAEGERVWVETRARRLMGRIGFGGLGWGRLCPVGRPDRPLRAEDLPAACDGLLLAGGAGLAPEAARLAWERGARGIVSTGMPAGPLEDLLGFRIRIADTVHTRLPAPLVLTVGVTPVPWPEEAWQLVSGSEGRPAVLSGATRLRAGARLPYLEIPVEEGERA